MSEELNEELLDKLTKVCLCKGISRASIKKAIAQGADSLERCRKLQAPVPAPAAADAAPLKF